MKQAILITAYKDLDFISNIIDYFDDDFDFFIHIDKKCNEDVSFLKNDSRVHVYSKYRIEWDGSNHIFAIVKLMQEASKADKYEYYHLITGSDYPLKSLSDFKKFFETHKNDNFMEYFELPSSRWGGDGGFRRIDYFWLFQNRIDNREKWKETIRLLIRIQKKLGIKRMFKYFTTLWGGSTYWSLSKDAINYALNFIKEKPGYIRRFHYTSIGEEIFLQTILLNNKEIKIENNYLRYVKWDWNGIKPFTLTNSDLKVLLNSDAFFARKFDKLESWSLINSLQKHQNKI
jgi:hypothetical protein